MTDPKLLDYWVASDVVYGESEPGGVETQSGTPSESTLLSDLSSFLSQIGETGWTPIDAQYIPADGFYGAAFLTSSDQIIISFEGTVPGFSSFDKGTESADYSIY